MDGIFPLSQGKGPRDATHSGDLEGASAQLQPSLLSGTSSFNK